ncbi:hypothetical protein MCERH10_01267 [Caulobacteraceae bacterium]
MLRPAIVTAALIALTGCAPTITSVGQARGTAHAGTAYYLPSSLTRIALVATDRGIFLKIGEPVIVADLRQPLFLLHNPSDLHNDLLKISVENGLLQTVESETEQQLEKIAKGAGTGLGGLRTLEGGEASDLVLFERFVDITDTKSLEAVSTELTNQLGDKGQARKIARERKILTEDNISATAKIELLTPEGASLAPDQKLTLAGCRVGICARPLVARTIRATLLGQTFDRVVTVPDTSVISAIPIPRRELSNLKTKLTLKDGVLKDYSIDSKSVVAEVMELPADLIGSYLSAANTALTNRSSLIKAETEALKAKAELDKTRNPAPTKAESAVELAGIPVPGFTLGAAVPPSVSAPGAGGSALAPRNGPTDAGTVTPPLDPKPPGKAGQ